MNNNIIKNKIKTGDYIVVFCLGDIEVVKDPIEPMANLLTY